LWSEKRFEIIRDSLGIKSGTLLDIGAHWGYFCHKFEEVGFQCTAMEGSMKNVYFMKKLKLAERLNFNVVSKSIFNYKDCEDFKDDLNFDVVLALSLFNQFVDMEKKDLCSELAEILGKIKAKEMYFQIPEDEKMQQSGKTGKSKNESFSSRELIDFIIKNTHFTHAEKIGEERNHGICKLY
jgi:cyclopropane fatty-acyl-phospholipid synthase-like methyltransferase